MLSCSFSILSAALGIRSFKRWLDCLPLGICSVWTSGEGWCQALRHRIRIWVIDFPGSANPCIKTVFSLPANNVPVYQLNQQFAVKQAPSRWHILWFHISVFCLAHCTTSNLLFINDHYRDREDERTAPFFVKGAVLFTGYSDHIWNCCPWPCSSSCSGFCLSSFISCSML